VRNGELKAFLLLLRGKSLDRIPFSGHFAEIVCVVEGESGGGGVWFDCTWLPAFKY